MTAFSQKYSPEQRQAIVDAVLDGVPGQPGSGPTGKGTPELGRQMTAREAQRAAKDGRLPDLEPFEMNLSTIRNYAQEARRDRDGKKPNRLDRKQPAEAADEVFRRVLRMTDATLRRAEVKAKSSKGLTLKELQELGQVATTIDKAAKQLMTRAAGTAAKGDVQVSGDQDVGAANAEPSDFAAQLAAQARGPSAPSDKTPNSPKGQGETNTPAADTPHEATTDHKDSEDRVRVRGESSSADPVRLAAAQRLLSSAM